MLVFVNVRVWIGSLMRDEQKTAMGGSSALYAVNISNKIDLEISRTKIDRERGRTNSNHMTPTYSRDLFQIASKWLPPPSMTRGGLGNRSV